MVVLVRNASEQMSFLEWKLKFCKIDHEVVEVDELGLKMPYLIVDGVPLDNSRSFKWIKERVANERNNVSEHN